MHNLRLEWKSSPLPGLMLAEPVDISTTLDVETCVERLGQMAESSEGKFVSTSQPISATSTRFHISHRVTRFYDVEASGYFIRRQNGSTIVTGQARISPLTYGVTLLFAALTVLFWQSVVAALFALLFLRMVMALVVSSRVCKAELVKRIEDTLTRL